MLNIFKLHHNVTLSITEQNNLKDNNNFHFTHFSFLLDCRVFSAGAFKRTWFIHVTEIRTVLLIKSLGIAANTADYRSALKWECPKNVSRNCIVALSLCSDHSDIHGNLAI